MCDGWDVVEKGKLNRLRLECSSKSVVMTGLHMVSVIALQAGPVTGSPALATFSELPST